MALVVKNLPTSAGEIRDLASNPELGRSPGGGHGNPLQYSCLENPMDREAWWATVHGVTQRQTRLKRLVMHPCTYSTRNSTQYVVIDRDGKEDEKECVGVCIYISNHIYIYTESYICMCN